MLFDYRRSISHSASREPRYQLLLFLSILILRMVMIESDLAESTIDIDLISVLGPFNLHGSLEPLYRFKLVSLLGHDLVRKGGTPHSGLVTLQHVQLHEVCTFTHWFGDGFTCDGLYVFL